MSAPSQAGLRALRAFERMPDERIEIDLLSANDISFRAKTGRRSAQVLKPLVEKGLLERRLTHSGALFRRTQRAGRQLRNPCQMAMQSQNDSPYS